MLTMEAEKRKGLRYMAVCINSNIYALYLLMSLYVVLRVLAVSLVKEEELVVLAQL